MVKVISIVFALVIANNSVAATKIPDIKRQIRTTVANVESGKVLQKVLFVRKDGKSYIPWMPITQKDMYKPENLEFISLINPSDIKVCGKLNFKIGKDKSDIEYPLKGLNHC